MKKTNHLKGWQITLITIGVIALVVSVGVSLLHSKESSTSTTIITAIGVIIFLFIIYWNVLRKYAEKIPIPKFLKKSNATTSDNTSTENSKKTNRGFFWWMDKVGWVAGSALCIYLLYFSWTSHRSNGTPGTDTHAAGTSPATQRAEIRYGNIQLLTLGPQTMEADVSYRFPVETHSYYFLPAEGDTAKLAIFLEDKLMETIINTNVKGVLVYQATFYTEPKYWPPMGKYEVRCSKSMKLKIFSDRDIADGLLRTIDRKNLYRKV